MNWPADDPKFVHPAAGLESGFYRTLTRSKSGNVFDSGVVRWNFRDGMAWLGSPLNPLADANTSADVIVDGAASRCLISFVSADPVQVVTHHASGKAVLLLTAWTDGCPRMAMASEVKGVDARWDGGGAVVQLNGYAVLVQEPADAIRATLKAIAGGEE